MRKIIKIMQSVMMKIIHLLIKMMKVMVQKASNAQL